MTRCSPVSGFVAAAHDLKMEWILIKGIKDYVNGDQPSSDEWGVFASVMAASVVANILRDPIIIQDWCHSGEGKRAPSLSPSFLLLKCLYIYFQSFSLKTGMNEIYIQCTVYIKDECNLEYIYYFSNVDKREKVVIFRQNDFFV